MMWSFLPDFLPIDQLTERQRSRVLVSFTRLVVGGITAVVPRLHRSR